MEIRDIEQLIEPAPARFSGRTWLGLSEEKVASCGLAILIAYAAVRSLFGTLSKPFWHDEMCTYAMAHLPSFSALWAALAHAADGNPPGFYWIERLFSTWVPNEQIAFRIPSILGFCCALLCIFLFVRKRSGGLLALACAGATLLTSLDGFSAEARPYSMVVACVAIALVCYQRAPAPGWMLLLGLSLALSQTLHYYAIFGLVPFCAAEAALYMKTRRVRWGVWFALFCGVLPLVAFWPLLSQFGKYMGPHFWSKPTVQGILEAYGEFLHLPAVFGIAVFAVASIGMFVIRPSMESRVSLVNSKEGTPFHEYILVFCLIVLPFVGFVATRLAHGGMNTRYVLAALLGLPLAAGYILPRLEHRLVILFLAFAGFSLALQEMSFWRSHPGRSASPANSVERLVTQAGYPDLPVVISTSITYMPIAYYASPEWGKRFFVLPDERKSIEYTGSDSVEAQLQILQKYIPLQLAELSDFASKHPLFLLYSQKTALIGDWWPVEFAREGHSPTLLAGDQAGRVYLVDFRANQH